MYRIAFLSVFLLGSVVSSAQLTGLMNKYHGRECVTVTQLDKTLYGLYQKKNIPAEAEELLKQLDEVNILNLNLALCDKSFREELTARFRSKLEQDAYKVIKSHRDAVKQQTIYTRSKNDRISDMVVWNETEQRLDIIELRGTIQAENIAMLSKALNIKGLNSLSSLNEENETYGNYLRSFDYSQMADMADSLFSSFGSGFDKMGNIFDQLGSQLNNWDWDGQNGIVIGNSNSVQITEENGKTKIKIHSTGKDLIYIVDGVKFEGEEVSLPEKIRDTRIVSDKNDPQRSYLIVLSQGKLGEFISFKNNILAFKYGDQTYKYTLDKNSLPLLHVNGKLTHSLEGTDLSRIRQIRPVSEAEKETGAFKSALVLIYTRQ